jgi:hypothetical protein
VKPREIKELVKTCYATGKPKLFIVGSPGCGKSSLLYQTFQEIGDPLAVLQAMLYDPVEIKGLPVYKEGKARFVPFEDMFPEMDKKGALFIDDIVHAPLQTQNSFMRLILEGKCGSLDLGQVYPIAAGNRSTDHAGAKDMQTALANRFVRVEFTIDYDDWRIWAVPKKIVPEIIAYLGTPYGKDWLDKFDATKQINPTPRSWEFASDLWKSCPKSILREALYGAIGEEATAKFLGWLKVYDKLPDLKAIIGGKNIFPEELDVMYAVISGLVSIATSFEGTKQRKPVFQRLIDYTVAMPGNFQELGAWLSKDLYKLDSQTFTACNLDGWRDQYAELIL